MGDGQMSVDQQIKQIIIEANKAENLQKSLPEGKKLPFILDVQKEVLPKTVAALLMSGGVHSYTMATLLNSQISEPLSENQVKVIARALYGNEQLEMVTIAGQPGRYKIVMKALKEYSESK